MQLHHLSLQLYTLRDFCKTAPEYAATLKKVKAIGYPAIQLSGVGPIPVAELRSIAEGEGLAITSTHEDSELILNEPGRVAERLAALGCRMTAYPYPRGIDFANPADVDRLVEKLEAAATVLEAAGQTLAYHNHAHEFFRPPGSRQPVLEAIYSRTQKLQGELDTYWAQAGGGDPVAWVKRLAGRLPMLHLKDYAVDATGQPRFAEIGAGNLDFKTIIAAAEAGGCASFIVEQDTCPGDPFESVRQSLDYIRRELVEG